MIKRVLPILVLACSATAFSFAQEPNPTASTPPQPVEGRNGVPLYRIEVVGRDIPAINYFNRSGSTRIGFQGTSLLPQAKGSAQVDSGKGNSTIDARLEKLPPANSFGAEYLTYVLWAISPEGRPINLGEVLPDGTKASIKVTTSLQAFGLIVTAEPYFAVTMPSDLVVLQNYVLPDRTAGIITPINAHTSLLPRGAYLQQTAGQHPVLNPITRNDRSPLDLYEAINAVQIAQATGAATYAPEVFSRAQQQLSNAQDLDAKKKDRKQEITYARAAVQSAEDARILTIRKRQEEERANQKQAQQAATSAAMLAAQQAQAQQAQAQNQALQAQLQAARAQAQAAQAAQAQATAERSAQQAGQQTEQMREKLRDQLNSVLQTEETARGLIVNLSDVLFDTGKYTLKSDTQIKLARVSGILLAYPNLKIQVEGYTDNVGKADYNQKLSEQRAGAVRDFLVSQGVQESNVSAVGYGLADPVADNSTADGRAKNRRVELVVSGQAIGIGQQSGPGTGGAQTTPPPQNQPQEQPRQQPMQRPNNTGVSNPPGEQPQR